MITVFDSTKILHIVIRINKIKLVGVILTFAFSVGVKAQVKNVKVFQVDRVQQGVAVDKSHFYVINNTSITKHDKETGNKISEIECKEFGLKHLNAGFVLDGKLYCAHSNFPDLPMASSVEIFDVETMQHLNSLSLGIEYGSLTWIDLKDGQWWAMYANYNLEGYPKTNDYTVLVRYSKDWIKLESYILPKDLIERFENHSSSGGFWLDDNRMLISGHDLPELYEVQLPKMGSVLKWAKTYEVPVHGQAIVLDKSTNEKIIYGVHRKQKQVIKYELK